MATDKYFFQRLSVVELSPCQFLLIERLTVFWAAIKKGTISLFRVGLLTPHLCEITPYLTFCWRASTAFY